LNPGLRPLSALVDKIATQSRISLLCDAREEPVEVQVQDFELFGAALRPTDQSIFAVCSPIERAEA